MKSNYSSRLVLSTVGVLLLLIFQASCDDRAVDPFEDEVEVFSIYGALDFANSSNIIRVKRATTFLLQDSSDIEPVNVIFNDLGDNTSFELTPEVIEFNGNFTFNYEIDYPIQPSSSYQVTMIASDGQQSIANARTPGLVIPSVDTLGITNNGPLLFDNTECTTVHEFVFANVKEGEQIYMFSGVKYQGQERWARAKTVNVPTRKFDTDSLVAEFSVRHFLLDHFPLSDERFVNIDPRFWPPTVDCNELSDNEIKIRYFHFSKDWENTNGEEITTDFLFDSGVVENGIGFFGGMNTGEFSYHFLQ